MKGIIKWYNYKDGVGFIKGEDEEEYLLLRDNVTVEKGKNYPHFYHLDKVVFELGDEVRDSVFLAIKVKSSRE
jgi:cold shock CspA family protein